MCRERGGPCRGGACSRSGVRAKEDAWTARQEGAAWTLRGEDTDLAGSHGKGSRRSRRRSAEGRRTPQPRAACRRARRCARWAAAACRWPPCHHRHGVRRSKERMGVAMAARRRSRGVLRACVHACVRACMRACMHACVRACVRAARVSTLLRVCVRAARVSPCCRRSVGHSQFRQPSGERGGAHGLCVDGGDSIARSRRDGERVPLESRNRGDVDETGGWATCGAIGASAAGCVTCERARAR